MTRREIDQRLPLDEIELGFLVAYFWSACQRWPVLTWDSVFDRAEYERTGQWP